MKILSRYILKEFLANLALGLIIFTFVLLLDHLFELVDLLINKGVGVGLTLELLFFLLPSSLSLTLPTSYLLAALLTFGHFSESNEITAMRASGLGAWSYVQTPVWMAVAAALILFPFNATWAPHAHAHFRQLYVEVLQRNPLVRIEEKTFVEIGDYHLYVNKRNRKTREMTGITIYKTPVEGAPLRIFAERGTASVDPVRGVSFNLQDGRIEQIDPNHPDQWFFTGFKTYILTIPFQTQAQSSDRALEEKDNRELRTEISALKLKHEPSPTLACEMNLRWALALTPLLFVGLGIPLAIRVRRGGRSIGFGLSILILILYYVVIMGGMGLGQRGLWPPWLAVWLANLLMAGSAAALCARFLRQ